MMDATWAEDHGYSYVACSRCGWRGMSDGPSCEGRCADTDRVVECDDCGEEGDDCSCEKCAICDEKVTSKWGDTCRCNPGPHIETFWRSTTHVARKADATFRVNPGDTYRRTVRGGYIKGGPRWMRSIKIVMKRAPKAS